MESRHEIVNFGSSVPVKIFLHKVGYVAHHWHKSLELLLVLEGTVEISISNKHFSLTEDDVILINSNEVHSLSSPACVMAAVQISLDMFDSAAVNAETLHFECNSSNFVNKTQFDSIKSIVANMLKVGHSGSQYSLILNQSLAYKLVYELMLNFKTSATAPAVNTSRNLSRISSIMDYIYQNYKAQISLSDIAQHEFISVPYLSKYFEKKTGTTLMNYIARVRLTHAVHDLQNTTHSIETIAFDNGFPNARSFASAFKKEYQVLPSEYRKNLTNTTINYEASDSGKIDYLDFEQHNYFDRLAKYLESEKPILVDSRPLLQSSPIIVNVQQSTVSLHHTFLEFTSVARAKDILLSPVQEMLKTIQREIGFRYIKFHGILGDDMMVYNEDSAGKPLYNFLFVDMVMDFLLSVGLKPLVQLSFMPRALAKTPERTRFYNPVVLGEPKDWEKWQNLVHELTAHLVSRYGLKEVESWLFCPWNEPDTTTAMYGFENDEIFFELHRRSYLGVKSVSPTLRFGGASLQPLFHMASNFGKKYTDWCVEHECPIDFFNINFYDLDFQDADLTKIWKDTSNKKIRLSRDPESFSKFITKLTGNIRRDGRNNPIYLTEWNSTASHSDLLSDTCYKSVYIVKNILENFDRLNSFGYWVLSDLHEEYLLSGQTFHGGLGLFTYNGIKKPGYYAYYLLSKLGKEKIASGDGYFITMSDKGYQIILYYYQHFSEMYSSGEKFDVTFADRYAAFPESRDKEYSVCLDKIENGTFLVRETFVNRESGSCFDEWLHLGGLPIESSEDLETLNCLSVPKTYRHTISVSDGKLLYNAVLAPLEIRLVEIMPMDG